MSGLSPLYCRYNGFTLGAFLTWMRFPYAAQRYRVYRRRVVEFLQEINVDLAVPATQKAFAPTADALLREVLALMKARSATLHDFTGLGAMAVLHGTNVKLVEETHRRVLHDRWSPVLEKHGIPVSTYDEWLQELPRRGMKLHAEDVLSPASLLLARLLESLDAEPETCFVAMSFREPFLRFFTTFYRPSLERNGMRAIRAWGGLASEEYYISLLTLISRSGAMLADVSTLNANVINEIGIAHGAPRVAFLIGRHPVRRLPSNIAHIPVHTYRPDRRDWPRTAIGKCAAYIQWMRRDFDVRYGQAYRDALEARLPPRKRQRRS